MSLSKWIKLKNQRIVFNLIIFLTLDNIPSAGLLKPPPIPGVGDYFDVMVPFAVNPYNFFVNKIFLLDQTMFDFALIFVGAAI